MTPCVQLSTSLETTVGDEEEEAPTIQPIPTMAQMLLGNDDDEADDYG